MNVTVKFQELDFYSYKYLIDALINCPSKVKVLCNGLPKELQERGLEIIGSLFHYHNHTLMRYLKAKNNVTNDQVNKYIMDNFNDPKVQELLNNVSIIGNQNV